MDKMEINVNKNAWITGSSRGIGRAIAEALAADGINVVLHGRNRTNLQTSGEGDDLFAVAANLAAKYNVNAIAVCGDLTIESEVSRCIAEITEKLGSIDILVCNAGGANLTRELDFNAGQETALDFALEKFQQRLDLNLLPTVLCCRKIAPNMVARQWGRIVTIGSIAGCGGNKTMGKTHMPYSLAKSAVMQYTRCLAGALRHDGIPVNCVIPGNINTPTTRIRYGGDREKSQAGLRRLEHVGEPEDIARLVAFLCGTGGEYISGQCIRVDGGEQLYPC